jgi:hypothetical protein
MGNYRKGWVGMGKDRKVCERIIGKYGKGCVWERIGNDVKGWERTGKYMNGWERMGRDGKG